MRLNSQTTLFIPDGGGTPVAYALKALRKDWRKIFGAELREVREPGDNQVRLCFAQDLIEEGFRVSHGLNDEHLLIEGADDLGLVFGIYYLCEHILGVDPYEFWTDFVYPRFDELEVAPFIYTAPRPRIRWRGWFINDEDCLRGWDGSYPMTLPTQEQIYESSLRVGYNLIIPYSAAFAGDPGVQLAADMGLWITHHHAQPLGARSFREVYPGVKALIPEELDKFVGLYREAIELNRGRKIIWGLGFRGQGDRAFFDPGDDERYDTYARQGKVISDMVRLQAELIKELTPEPHHFAHNLYAESVELYRSGHLQLADDIIRVWGDNGFGAMRRRRTVYQPERHMSALPGPEDRDKSNGVYYHLSFNDIRISSKITPLVQPELIQEQFQLAFDAGNLDLLTVNVSNIHPHVFDSELIGKIARFPAERPQLPDTLVSQHYVDWNNKHFPGFEPEVSALTRRYYEAPFMYGVYPDDRAGEQVYHHGLRNLIYGVLNERTVLERFCYIPDRPANNEGIIEWHIQRAGDSLPGWEALERDAKALHARMEGAMAQYFHDYLLMHIRYIHASCRGFVQGLRGLLAYMQGDLKAALGLFTDAKDLMQAAWDVLQENAHDKWEGFFRGEYVTGTRMTIRYLATIQGLCRINLHEDVPRERWAAKYLGPEAAGLLPRTDVETDVLGRAILAWERKGVDDLELSD